MASLQASGREHMLSSAAWREPRAYVTLPEAESHPGGAGVAADASPIRIAGEQVI